MKIKFRDIRMSKPNRERLEVINSIIEEYQELDLVLTLRQLYYQLVSRDIIANQVKEYAKLSGLLKEGRMAGIVDWDAIEDRLRKPSKPSEWDSSKSILDACIDQYEKKRMEGQANYIEVWVEKDALSGVLSRVTEKYHIPIMVNRGYSSASAMFDAFNRFKAAKLNGQLNKVLYLGDYDPSGLDMIRDIEKRIDEFADGWWPGNTYARHTFGFEVIPIALTREQIDLYTPPPNPAKLQDPRAGKFVEDHGYQSWEVDALRPEVLHQILEDAILERIDPELYDNIVDSEEADKDKLRSLYQYL